MRHATEANCLFVLQRVGCSVPSLRETDSGAYVLLHDEARGLVLADLATLADPGLAGGRPLAFRLPGQATIDRLGPAAVPVHSPKDPTELRPPSIHLPPRSHAWPCATSSCAATPTCSFGGVVSPVYRNSLIPWESLLTASAALGWLCTLCAPDRSALATDGSQGHDFFSRYRAHNASLASGSHLCRTP